MNARSVIIQLSLCVCVCVCLSVCPVQIIFVCLRRPAIVPIENIGRIEGFFFNFVWILLKRLRYVCFVALFPSDAKPALIGSVNFDTCIIDWEFAVTMHRLQLSSESHDSPGLIASVDHV